MTSRAESCPPKLVPKNATFDKPNPALRGAAQAYSARAANLNPPANAQSTSIGAAAAAAAAAGNRGIVKNAPPPRPIKHQDVHRPAPIKSPSHSAAQAASARASPQKDSVPEKISIEPNSIYVLRKSPQQMRDTVLEQKSEAEEDHSRDRPWLDDTIAVPQPVRPLPQSAALTAILGHEPEISPGSTPNSASPPVMTSNISAGISAARLAARRATPATRLSDPSPDALVKDLPWPSVGSMESLPGSKDGFRQPLGGETSFPTSSIHGLPVRIGPTRWQTMQDTNSSVGREPEGAANSAMKRRASVIESTSTAAGRDSESAANSGMNWTTSGEESLQSASKSPPKNAIAADAIIAWSVASSRAASPAKMDPPPTLRRRSKSFGMFHHHQKTSEHHSPHLNAPIHVLKHTLRKHHQPDEDDEENAIVKRGRRHFIRKHQHKHHEGDRKRWRDRVTEKERKRYEGVWAANRGLFTFWDFSTTAFENPSKPPPEPDAVLNMVVREVWERSRLPKGELEEVWDLVARESANTLRRDEFVVGMWLLDQCLKGRKLPVRVSPSVWASVRHTLKIRAMP